MFWLLPIEAGRHYLVRVNHVHLRTLEENERDIQLRINHNIQIIALCVKLWHFNANARRGTWPELVIGKHVILECLMLWSPVPLAWWTHVAQKPTLRKQYNPFFHAIWVCAYNMLFHIPHLFVSFCFSLKGHKWYLNKLLVVTMNFYFQVI